MTTKLTLISTIYSIEPVIVCATRFSSSRIILLSEGNGFKITSAGRIAII